VVDLIELSEVQEVAVYRGSTKSVTIDSSELVVGDIFYFESGMKVPADCIMIQGQDTICTEGDLTGEPFGVEKIPLNENNYKNGVMCTMFAKSLIN
jgi:Ca2+-transporting ATPase